MSPPSSKSPSACCRGSATLLSLSSRAKRGICSSRRSPWLPAIPKSEKTISAVFDFSFFLGIKNAMIGEGRIVFMETRQRYKRFYIDTRSYELRDGSGWTAEFTIEEHDGAGVTETQFFLKDTFPTRQLAIEAAIGWGRRKIDAGFHAPAVSI